MHYPRIGKKSSIRLLALLLLVTMTQLLSSQQATAVTSSGVTSTHSQAFAQMSVEEGGEFVPLQSRLIDTRPAYQVGSITGPFPANAWQDIQVGGQAGVPSSGVSAVAVSFVAVSPSLGGYINASAAGVTPGTISVLNYLAGTTTTGSSIVPVSDLGKIQIWAASSTHLIIDITGYYTAATSTTAGYVPVTPTRLFDTRFTTPPGQPSGVLTAASPYVVRVTGNAGVPSGAIAAAVNITVVSPSTAGIFSAYPVGTSNPGTAYAYPSGPATNIGTIVPLSTTGSPLGAFNFKLNVGTAYLVVDVVGYFTASATGGQFMPTPGRIVDTRPSSAIPANGTLTLSLSNVPGFFATGSAAAAMNLTVVTPSVSGHLKAWATGTAEPSTSALNFTAGTSAASSLAISATSESGQVTLKNMSTAPVYVVADLHGFFTPATDVPTDGVEETFDSSVSYERVAARRGDGSIDTDTEFDALDQAYQDDGYYDGLPAADIAAIRAALQAALDSSSADETAAHRSAAEGLTPSAGRSVNRGTTCYFSGVALWKVHVIPVPWFSGLRGLSTTSCTSLPITCHIGGSVLVGTPPVYGGTGFYFPPAGACQASTQGGLLAPRGAIPALNWIVVQALTANGKLRTSKPFRQTVK